MTIIVTTNSTDDDHPAMLQWTNADHEDAYQITMWLSPTDGVPTVQIDTPPNAGPFRIRVNDGPPVWNADPEHVHDFERGRTETHSLCFDCGQCDGGN